MPAATRIYLVTTPNSARLVRAINAAAAVRHVAADEIKCAVAGQDDLVVLVGRGVRVEAAGEPAPPAANEPNQIERLCGLTAAQLEMDCDAPPAHASP